MEGGSHDVRIQGELTATVEKDVVQIRTCLSFCWRYFCFLTFSFSESPPFHPRTDSSFDLRRLHLFYFPCLYLVECVLFKRMTVMFIINMPNLALIIVCFIL